MKKDHAEHNESLCSKLLAEDKYRDWVITTAFYSAIHFIDYKVFPLEHDGKVFQSINEIKKHLKSPSPHAARQSVVGLYLVDQLPNYAFLDKNCRNARYTDYNISKDKAKQAFQRLSQLKNKCTSDSK